MMLVSLEQAKDHLLVTHDADDADIAAKIRGASAAILNYLDGAPVGQVERDLQGREVKDDNGQPVYEYDSDGLVVRFEVQSACLMLVAEWYKNREAEQDGEVKEGYGYLPRPVTAILFPIRQQVIA